MNANEIINAINEIECLAASVNDDGTISIEMVNGNNADAVADQIITKFPAEIAKVLKYVDSDESAMVANFEVEEVR